MQSKTLGILLHYILWPFAALYGIVILLRNQLFDWGILPQERFKIPVISIGNLAVGGTGKTPHTEYLVRLLQASGYRVAVLSHGYRRKSKGFLLATSLHNSEEIGDEPYQLKQKFPQLTVAVDANRRRGIHQLQALPKEEQPDLILLDDAYQHRYVCPTLSILLTDSHRLGYDDCLLPAGRLREPWKNRDRADIVIVTKCEDKLTTADYNRITEKLKLHKNQQLYFTTVDYDDPHPLYPAEAPALQWHQIQQEDPFILLAGIAHPESFVEYVKQRTACRAVFVFQDHHQFSKQELQTIDNSLRTIPRCRLITTEKDAARLIGHPALPLSWHQKLYYLPITVRFCAEGERFDQTILQQLY